MQDPVLSICIPTFNRAEFLKECLASIIPQLNGSIGEKVEVVISDNGSTDHTKKIAEEFLTKYKNIRYFKNAENIGFDRNVLSAVEKAKGDYCWLLGDDDALFKGSLEYIIPILEKGEYGYLLANTWGYDKGLGSPALSRPNLHIQNDLIFQSLREFVASISDYNNLVGYFGGMSAQLFSRKVWQNFELKEKFIGSQAIHLHIILSAYKNIKTCVLAKPLVKTRADNIRWETFPGLESNKKRQEATTKGVVWILNEYGIPYSNLRIKLNYYNGLVYGLLLFLAKRTVLKSFFIKKNLKKILGK